MTAGRFAYPPLEGYDVFFCLKFDLTQEKSGGIDKGWHPVGCLNG